VIKHAGLRTFLDLLLGVFCRTADLPFTDLVDCSRIVSTSRSSPIAREAFTQNRVAGLSNERTRRLADASVA
jgi:hypothetical protein